MNKADKVGKSSHVDPESKKAKHRLKCSCGSPIMRLSVSKRLYCIKSHKILNTRENEQGNHFTV